MKWITCHDGRLQVQAVQEDGQEGGVAPARAFVAPAAGAVHELLFDPAEGSAPLTPALAAVRNALAASTGALVWCDPEATLYPPALAAAGVAVERIYMLRPKPADLVEVVADCLRCPGVAATVASLPPRLTRPAARRLQLAAEAGRGLGVMLREQGRGTDVYAAATRWKVSPTPGERRSQRWRIELVHGFGRAVGQPFTLEVSRASAGFVFDTGPWPGVPDAAERLAGTLDRDAAVRLRVPAALATGPATAADARALA